MLTFGEIRDELREGVHPMKLIFRLVRGGNSFRDSFNRVYRAFQTL